MTVERMPASQARALLQKPKKKAKYRNTPVVIDGIRFASKKEGAYYGALKQREKAGEVSAVELQTPFALVGPDGTLITTYRADFCFWDHVADRFRVVDVKGFSTDAFKMKRKLMRSLKGIEVEIV